MDDYLNLLKCIFFLFVTCLSTLFKYVSWLSFLLSSLYFLFENFCLLQWYVYYSCKILEFYFLYLHAIHFKWKVVMTWGSHKDIQLNQHHKAYFSLFLIVALFSLTLIYINLILVSLLYPLFCLSSLGPIYVIHCCIFLLVLTYKMFKIYQILIFHLLKWSHIFPLLNKMNNF